MLPQFLIPESTLRANGVSSPLLLGESRGRMLQLTLSIRRALEQESVEISIEGSSDGENWLEKPLAHFPQKFYCGDYVILCDLAAHPEISHLRATWKLNRWGRGDLTPMFDVFLFVELAKQMVASAAG
ncbi:MAG: hypothetical protein OHK0021_18050 [Bryobacter sp.]